VACTDKQDVAVYACTDQQPVWLIQMSRAWRARLAHSDVNKATTSKAKVQTHNAKATRTENIYRKTDIGTMEEKNSWSFANVHRCT